MNIRNISHTQFSRAVLLGLMVLISATSLLAQDAAVARVVKSRGGVTLKKVSDTDFVNALVPAMELFPGDAIRSVEGAFASIIFLDDKSLLKLKDASQFQIVESASTRTIDMQYGTIRSILPEPIKDFAVQTPNSVASVKGTDFWMISDETTGTDQLYGIEGVVEILNIISGLTQTLVAGTMIISTAAGQLTPPIPVSPSQLPDDPDDAPENTQPEPEGDGDGEGDGEADASDAPSDPSADITPTDTETLFEGLTQDVTQPAATPIPEEVADAEEEPKEKPAEASSGPGLGLGLGSVTLDGQTYTSVALRPEFSFGKLGIGLDIVAYMDGAGNIRDDEWDEKSDYLDKLMYLRWGTPQDPFFFSIGAMPSVQYGFGAIMSGYSNMAEFPEVRRVGFEIGGNIKKFNVRAFSADLKAFNNGSALIGFRGTYKVSKSFPMTLGMNFVTDLNQYGSLKDKDGDGRPDLLDDFPDDDTAWLDSDGDGLADNDTLEFDIDGDGWTDNAPFAQAHLNNDFDGIQAKPEPFNIGSNNSSLTAISFDLSYPIFSSKLLDLTAYTEYGILNYATKLQAIAGEDTIRESSGSGLIGPGIRANILKFINVSVEYRSTSPLFQPGFFNATYDLERAQLFASGVSGAGVDSVRTKDQVSINNAYALSGIYGTVSANLLNLVTFGVAYQKLTPAVADTSAQESQSFLASLSINTDPIPKISEAMAYYIRTNDPDVFAFDKPSANTTWGYRIAYALAPKVDMVYNQQVSYRNVAGKIEEVRLLTIETAFRF